MSSVVELYKETSRVDREDLEEAMEQELLDLKILVDEDIMHIGLQLDDAKTALVTTGEYADAQWYRDATAAKKIKGHLSQQIQNLIGAIKRRRKESLDVVQFETMREVLKEILTEEQEQEVWDLFVSRMKEIEV